MSTNTSDNIQIQSKYHLTPLELALAAEIEGFAMSYNRVGELFLADELSIPAEPDDLLFSEDELQQVREACDRRRWWIPTAKQHDPKRTPVERRYCHEFRQAMAERVQFVRSASVSTILNLLMSEPSLEMRRVYRAVLYCRYDEAMKQVKAVTNA